MATLNPSLPNFNWPQEIDRTDAELLLAHVLKRPREYILARNHFLLKPRERRQFTNLIRRRAKGEPLAYLLRMQPFYGLNFLVNNDVLIPRPETEYLVEQSTRLLHEHPEIQTVVDIGTGSGCIIVALWKSLPPTKRRALNWYATDVSSAALKVAKRNAKKHQTKNISFARGDLLDPLTSKRMAYRVWRRAPILILANLPYLTTKDYREAPNDIRAFEPRNALLAGTDGLTYYRPLVESLKKIPAEWYGLWEIDPCHAKKLATLVTKKTGLVAEIKKDLNGLKRYLEVI